jgi:hypothetical protein
MADYSQPYSKHNPMEVRHYPHTVDDVLQARVDASTDERDWTYHTINYSSPDLISNICDRIMSLEERLSNG